MGQWRLMGCGVLALALWASASAHAQVATPDSNSIYGSDPAAQPATAVVMPPLPEEPLRRKPQRRIVDLDKATGFDDGAFQIKPSLEMGTVMTNNINLSSTNHQSDIGLRLKPSLAFQSQWSRHSWRGSASAEWLHYLATPSASTVTGTAETAFRLDIRRNTFADFTTNANVTASTAGASEVPNSAVGTRQDWNLGTTAAINHDFGPMQGRLKFGIMRQAFGNVALSGGGTENNTDRNYIEPSMSLRGTWGSPAARLKPYVELTYDPRFHDQTVDRNGQKRNSQGVGAALGVTLQDGPIWTGDFSANFIARSYDDPALKTAMAVGLIGSLTWSPTPLWNVVASSGVGLAESEVASVSATPSWNAGLNASYAMRDNITLHTGGSATFTNRTSGIDTTLVANAGADWQLNPYLSLSGTLQSTWFNAATATSNYNEHRAMLGVVVKP